MSKPVLSTEWWRLTDEQGEGLVFDVPGDVIWQRAYRGRNTLPICGGNTVTVRGLGKRSIKIQILLPPSSTRNTRKDQILAMADQSILYWLFPPGGEQIYVKFDPAVAIEERWQNGARVLTVGFQEIDQSVDTGAPPPGAPPFILWANPGSTVNIPAGVESVPVTVSWGGQIHPTVDSKIYITNIAHNIFYGNGLIATKTVVGSMVYIVSRGDPPPDGTYQWTLRPIDNTSYTPAYSDHFSITRL